jgi:hypothetical protein
MTGKPIVFFDPHQGIWPHAFPEALVASAIKQSGAEVIYATCDGLLAAGCYVMSAHGLKHSAPEASRRAVCTMCRKRRDALVSGLGVRSVSIDSLVSAEDQSKAADFANSVGREDIVSLDVDGFKVGRISLHETIIHHKLTALEELTSDSMDEFRVNLLNVMLALRATQALLKTLRPARIVSYNTHASTNYVMMLAAEKAGVPTFGLHAGGNMSNRFASLYVFRQDIVKLYKDWIANFDQSWGSLPTTRKGMRAASSHFLALTAGKTLWVYSAPKRSKYFDVRAHYGVASHQKILLATLSSYDELFSSQMMGIMDSPPLMFPSQVEWMRHLIDHVAQRPDLFLIIRVHPRELPNLRDKVHSTHAKKLAELLVDLPNNVRVNWPKEGISLYDLIPQVDVGLNGWSSTGKEVALLGVPVVLFTGDILFYPASLNRLAKNQPDYFQCIDEAIESGWSFERVRQVFRWLAVEYTLGTIDISDRFVYKEGARSLIRRAMGRLRRTLAYRFEASRLHRRLATSADLAKVILEDASVVDLQVSQQGRLDAAEEDRLLRQEVKTIVEVVYGQIPHGVSNAIDSLRRETGAKARV